MSLLSLSALVLGVGVGMQAQPQGAIPSAPPLVPVTDVMVLLTRKPNVSVPDLMKVLPEEARQTMLMNSQGQSDDGVGGCDR
jgi:hypothetical protein